MELAERPVADVALGDRIVKVNHAGEHGAVSIYTGQILMARVTASDMVGELIEFRSHERRHRSLFEAELRRRGRARCRSYWLCACGGLALGLITGLLGKNAIAATTAAVESVVLRHLTQQLAMLREQDPEAVIAISAIIEEEQQHHDQSVSHGADGFWRRVLTPVVSASTESVIWLGMRL
ncbi:demethoxyubiquinone hydroxylase family protein [Pseudoxanthomonas sacheonensis]|uniref:demethoxyubiquinone hydroxylase family protein n=1 Tax=Pseudoxanthomonas sacheonensis TaxID=443615 RepID=UPI0013D1CCE3|nr:demethoxyubiquinone hydroxylase family protein [Pseudoxanthomonas sacheonensis]KAF1709574.1 demethoxyubiquinone hydroxylase family protein [Pseudoxanthomonas sacheonensis]